MRLLQILSGASNGFNTGMPKQDIVLATAVATAVATATMGKWVREEGGCPHCIAGRELLHSVHCLTNTNRSAMCVSLVDR